ncbi:MAG TPA: hypothetical protein VEF34_07845 [Syntrophobacteraceae bacterium]|nr:hypothetical protein [Syntrophobacteraceae bacterium]
MQASTSIRLITWEQFQDAFESSWFDHFFSPTITDRLDELFDYTEPLHGPTGFESLSETEKQDFITIRSKYTVFSWYCMTFTTYGRRVVHEFLPQPPLKANVNERLQKIIGFPVKLLQENGYREFLEGALEIGEKAIAELRRALKKDIDTKEKNEVSTILISRPSGDPMGRVSRLSQLAATLRAPSCVTGLPKVPEARKSKVAKGKTTILAAFVDDVQLIPAKDRPVCLSWGHRIGFISAPFPRFDEKWTGFGQ